MESASLQDEVYGSEGALISGLARDERAFVRVQYTGAGGECVTFSSSSHVTEPFGAELTA